MSTNLHLTATLRMTGKLSNGNIETKDVVDTFELWQTPSDVSHAAMKGDPHAEYIRYIREVEPQDFMLLGIVHYETHIEYYEEEEYYQYIDQEDREAGTWDKLEKEMYPTQRYEHEKELEVWLSDHEGWLIEWDAW